MLTEKQQSVLQCLTRASKPLTAYEMLDQLHDDGFRAPPQVYRALNKLCEMGRIHRLETLNAFVACDQHDCGTQVPSVFLICTECQTVSEIHARGAWNGLSELILHNGFRLNQAVIELSGICAPCEGSDPVLEVD